MRVDSEINLAIEQAGSAPVVQGWRRRLLAEHLGTTPKTLAATEEETGSLIAAIDVLNQRDARRHCRPLRLEGEPLPRSLGELAELADPLEPIIRDQILGPWMPLRDRRRWRRWRGRVAGLAGLILVTLPWLASWTAWTVPLGLALIALWVLAARLWRPELR